MGNIAKKGSGNITVTRDVSKTPSIKLMSPPGPGGSGGEGMTRKGSGNITVDRTVKSPPTRKG